jgi:hypothetical protein
MDNKSEIIICSVCGKKQNLNEYAFDFSKELKRYVMCFHCHFWMIDVGASNYVVIEGSAYSIGEEKFDGCIGFERKGYGGRRFIIKRKNGCIIETTNLWHRGDVSDNFRDKFPDDAVFLKMPNEFLPYGVELNEPNGICNFNLPYEGW